MKIISVLGLFAWLSEGVLGQILLNAEANPKYIISPNHPMDYPGNLFMKWSLGSPTPGRYIVMKFLDFELEGSGSCGYDKLTIFTGNIMTGVYCGRQLDGHVWYTGSRRVNLTFQTDNTINKEGFRIAYYTSTDKVDPEEVYEKLITYIIVGVVVGVILIVIFIAACLFFAYIANKKKRVVHVHAKSHRQNQHVNQPATIQVGGAAANVGPPPSYFDAVDGAPGSVPPPFLYVPPTSSSYSQF